LEKGLPGLPNPHIKMNRLVIDFDIYLETIKNHVEQLAPFSLEVGVSTVSQIGHEMESISRFHQAAV
jgi:hypothetical protein